MGFEWLLKGQGGSLAWRDCFTDAGLMEALTAKILSVLSPAGGRGGRVKLHHALRWDRPVFASVVSPSRSKASCLAFSHRKGLTGAPD